MLEREAVALECRRGGESGMRRVGISLAALLAAGALVAAPVVAAHKRMARVSCKQIKDALAAGKSTDDVQKELKVNEGRVKACTEPAAAKKPARHHRAPNAS